LLFDQIAIVGSIALELGELTLENKHLDSILTTVVAKWSI
jgi:hypothetical protein